jgi:hypothetical protein
VTMLQSLYRVIPCTQGYKYFLEIKEIDTRLLLFQLLKIPNDFVNYWTLELLIVLCKVSQCITYVHVYTYIYIYMYIYIYIYMYTNILKTTILVPFTASTAAAGIHQQTHSTDRRHVEVSHQLDEQY